MNTLQRAIMEQIRCSAQLRQKIGRQVAEVMTIGRASTRITVKVPMPMEDVKTDYVPNVNRGKKRFVLNEHSGKNKGKVK